MAGYWVVLTTLLLGALLLAAASLARRSLAPSHPTPGGVATYESGVDPEGPITPATLRYLVFAVLYVVFAVDVVYLFPWALVLRTDLGPAALLEMGIFLGVLVLALAHVWRRGLLRWW